MKRKEARAKSRMDWENFIAEGDRGIEGLEQPKSRAASLNECFCAVVPLCPIWQNLF
jgi:hypothetical protein